jgi:hypothetical protein
MELQLSLLLLLLISSHALHATEGKDIIFCLPKPLVAAPNPLEWLPLP